MIGQHKKLFLVSTLVCLVAVGVSFVLFSKESETGVVLRDFNPGTRVAYEIMSEQGTVEEGEQVLKEDGILTLPIPEKVAMESDQFQYKLRVEPPSEDGVHPAEALNLLLGLDQVTGDVSVSGDGLEAFANILVRKGSQSEEITTDWAGLFSADSLNKNLGEDSPYHDQIQLAFQNAGIDSDFNHLGDGKVDVLFGDSSGSSLGAVQVRYSNALIRMAHELSVVMVMQTEAIGMFFDAKIQMKTQRKHQELQARAHKDYHPSEQMCRIGTFMRSVASSESKADLNKYALNKILMTRYMGTKESSAGYGNGVSKSGEILNYNDMLCDARDNDGATSALCAMGATPSVAERERVNKDIDYTRTVDAALTIDVDFSDGPLGTTPNNDLSDDEAAVISMAKNLYFPNVFEVPEENILEYDSRTNYNARSFVSRMNVAHSTFLNIVGMKSSAPPGTATTTTATTPPPPPFGSGSEIEGSGPWNPAPPPLLPLQTNLVNTRPAAPPIIAEDSGWAYMKALLREFGITPQDGNGNLTTTDPEDYTVDEQINKILGQRPSYYAQMEVLTKKIYQHPNFYTNLYDKPANVMRIGASIDAIALMHQRDRFESSLRREMLTSLLIEEGLAKHVEEVNSKIYEEMQGTQR